jgi:LPXTG-motif cell wall-anchored protein
VASAPSNRGAGGGSSSNLLPVVLIVIVLLVLGAFALYRWRRRPAEE